MESEKAMCDAPTAMGSRKAMCDASLARAFDVLGKRWTGMLLGSLTAGPATFTELGRGVTGISQSVLSDRLGELARVGLVARTVHEGPPLAVSYALTANGEALVPALEALATWAGEHLDEATCARARRRAARDGSAADPAPAAAG